MSPDPQAKALQAHPQSPGLVQKPQSGPIPVANPVVKLVSPRPRARSHSPSYRIEVDVEPEYQGGWQKAMRPTVSHNSLMVPSEWESKPFNSTDLLSQSFPDNFLSTAQSRQRHSYSPASNCGNLLQVPDNNHFPFNGGRRGEGWGRREVNGSSSMCDLSASAPADMLRHIMGRPTGSRSSECLVSSAPTTSLNWLGLSPRTSPRTSPQTSPTPSPSSSRLSVNSPSPPFSPEGFAHRSPSPTHTQHLMLGHPFHPRLMPPASTPHCFPCNSPFGSRTQLDIRTVEC